MAAARPPSTMSKSGGVSPLFKLFQKPAKAGPGPFYKRVAEFSRANVGGSRLCVLGLIVVAVLLTIGYCAGKGLGFGGLGGPHGGLGFSAVLPAALMARSSARPHWAPAAIGWCYSRPHD